MPQQDVLLQPCASYDADVVRAAVAQLEPIFTATIRRGDVVAIKPNWIAPRHKYNPDEWQSVITHPSVIGAVLDLVCRSLQGAGRVLITDGPQTDSSWSALMERMQPDEWVAIGRRYGIPVTILDLRDHEWTVRGDVNVGRHALPGDPMGSTVCDLGAFSEFEGHRPSRHGYYGADYDKQETNDVHRPGRHMYKVSRSVMTADVLVNLPKMKTHKKAGITCSLKNLVGINTYKNWLPHHTEGTPDQGGDQFPGASSKNRLERIATERFKAVLSAHPWAGSWLVPVKSLGKRLFGETRNTVRNGAWHGNDTLWRTVLDLNKILMYANPDGSLRPDDAASRKRYISVVDAVVAGEGNGPEAPDPKACGVLVAGTNPVAVDAACARVMGLDWSRIPSVRQAFAVGHYRLCDFAYSDVTVTSRQLAWSGPLADLPSSVTFRFRPHFGWRGHLELEDSRTARAS